VKKATKIVKKIEYVEEALPDGSKKRKAIEKLENKLDKLLGKKILIELSRLLKRGSISQQAYDVLHSDIEWMIDH
jgi:hypothetical protein